MTAPAPIPPPPSAPPVPSTEGRASARWVVPSVAAVVAAGAGIGLGWLLWSGPDSAASGTGLDDAAADAAGACQVWARVPALDKMFNKDDNTSVPYWYRTGSAANLAHSAAELDDRYKALDKALQKVTGLVQTFEVKGAKAVAAHDKVSTLCAELDD
ncbi:hypothetical protein SHKM778_30000 [Streptomyces sp. KM77-8]|uniref:Uncharacterized protein n=1 Tax=Streptomyces haneummycinicus TaxID=3074435 RepID=A0AAT9HGS9_9ACTN